MVIEEKSGNVCVIVTVPLFLGVCVNFSVYECTNVQITITYILRFKL